MSLPRWRLPADDMILSAVSGRSSFQLGRRRLVAAAAPKVIGNLLHSMNSSAQSDRSLEGSELISVPKLTRRLRCSRIGDPASIKSMRTTPQSLRSSSSAAAFKGGEMERTLAYTRGTRKRFASNWRPLEFTNPPPPFERKEFQYNPSYNSLYKRGRWHGLDNSVSQTTPKSLHFSLQEL